MTANNVYSFHAPVFVPPEWRLGYVEASWTTAESGRRRRYYRITEAGRAHLATQRQEWQVVDATMRGIWRQRIPARAFG